MKPNSFQSLSPHSFIKAAQAAHPAFKYAMVVAGLAAIVAIVIRFGVSPATLVFGIIILVILMILFLVFARAAAVTTANLTLPSLVLIWSFLLLAIATAVLLFTSAFFDIPLPLKRAIIKAEILPAAQDEGAHQSPDVTLRFVYPKSPALILVNQSAVIAKDIKWTVALWNMDLPDRNDPLPIPVSTFDWIKPHHEGGPQNLFDGPLVSPLLKQGNRLFGSASVICPECARGRTYIVYIVWGDSGWFSEIENGKSGKIVIPPDFSKTSRIEYFKALEAAVPPQSRMAIGER